MRALQVDWVPSMKSPCHMKAFGMAFLPAFLDFRTSPGEQNEG